jgi:hypothetical protein
LRSGGAERASRASTSLTPVPELARRRREAYDRLDRKSQIGLVGWSAFTTTFTGVRVLTHAIRAGRGPFRNLSLGGEHLHHYMWGILMVGTSGGLALAVQPTEDRTTTLAAVYGAGAALIVDEFALLLDLQDVYWAKQGRISVDIGIGAIASIGTYVVAIPFWRHIVAGRHRASLMPVR